MLFHQINSRHMYGLKSRLPMTIYLTHHCGINIHVEIYPRRDAISEVIIYLMSLSFG